MSKTEFHGSVGAVVQGENAKVVIYPHDNKLKNPNSPNLVDCPDCGNLVSWRSNNCPGCGLNVEKHFQQIFHSQQQAKFFKLFILAMLGVIFGIALKVFGYDPVGWLGEVFIFGGMLTAIAGGKLIESGKI